MLLKGKSSKRLVDLPTQDWVCHCCSAKNVQEAAKCRVCGRLESYALQGYRLPFHGKNSTLFRSSQVLTVLENIHEVDSEKWTSLHSACASGNYDIVRDLLSYKAKVEALTNKSQTPLHLAVYSGNTDCVKELIKYNANVNAVTAHEKCTPLHIACQKGYAEIAHILIESGATIDALNILKRTPLHLAAESGRVEIGKLMLSCGADRHALDIHGWSVRQIAELFNHRDFQELMIREGMTEKQVIIKELPTAEWHSSLWFDVTNMHKQRTEEYLEKTRQAQHDEALVQSFQKSRQDKVIAQRRAERAIEIEAYNEKKNQAKEIQRIYAEQMAALQDTIRARQLTEGTEHSEQGNNNTSKRFENMITTRFVERGVRTQTMYNPDSAKKQAIPAGLRPGSRGASRLSSAGARAVAGPRTPSR